MKRTSFFFVGLASSFLLIFFVGCRDEKKDGHFSKLSSAETGIRFRNEIRDNDSSNSFINEFGYMGGGVGIGDFNNDGKKDVFFTANQTSSRLYLNEGNMQFKDITEAAGLTTSDWATGVSIVDINNDGYDDIYICTYGKNLLRRSPNLLYINQKNLTFKEQAAEYGLADTSYSSQATFLDYDRDGDLDMFLVNYSFNNSNVNANNIVTKDLSGHSTANDRLYRNDGNGQGHPVFIDVSLEAGIKEDGYGLGVTVSDFNGDGWPDIYVANDFVSNDNLWQNNGDGTFTNRIATALRHQSYSSMGVDAADMNNDGLSDIVTLDMLPEYNERKKTSFFFMNYERYQAERFKGYEPEFMRNMLQLNNGNRFRGDTAVPFFSEIGQLAGISATDWSWSVLLADFDNDGWKDMHITNGVGRDFIHADFLEFSSQVASTIADKAERQIAIKQKLASLEHVKLANYLYINNRDYTYTNAATGAGIDEPSLSNGAAYADLDNDGDLDLLVNNINDEAFLFLNNSRQPAKEPTNHFLKFVLQGPDKNRSGIGTKLFLYNKGEVQQAEQNPVRGYYSSVDRDIVFGTGTATQVDSVVVLWPDGKRETRRSLPTDSAYTLQYANAATAPTDTSPVSPAFFEAMSEEAGIHYRHTEYEFNDFANQRLLPQKFSQMGPYLAIGDVNGDGSTDFFVGGGSGFQGKLFLQGSKASFAGREIGIGPKPEEDIDCLLFDADGDKDLDLLLTSGDVQQPPGSTAFRPRLYRNDGKGNFSLDEKAIPARVQTIAGTVAAADWDNDGDQDIFIGGRVSHRYPEIPQSFLLQNNGGTFTDVTATVCPALQKAGMLTSATWVDIDKDGQADLVVAGEWMPLRFFKNEKGSLKEVTTATGLSANEGMWRSLVAADIDNDGDMDLVAGNLGANCTYQVSPEQPMQLYAKDIDNNGSMDPVSFYYIKDKSGDKKLYPAISRAQFADQVPAIKKQFLFAKDYTAASFDNIFSKTQKEGMLQFTCRETRSCYFENLGGGRFQKHALPAEAQFAPVNAILAEDFDGDGYPDLLLAGNEYQAEVITGRYDASYGSFLKGSQSGFRYIPNVKSGFFVDGDVKDMAVVPVSQNEKMIVVALNNDSLKVFRVRKEEAKLTAGKR